MIWAICSRVTTPSAGWTRTDDGALLRDTPDRCTDKVPLISGAAQFCAALFYAQFDSTAANFYNST